ncbi:MAG: nucleotidyltransferase domain-containing protein [Candidatus Poribacteria bacterium]
MKSMKKHHNSEKQKQVILSELAEILKAEESVVFAYAYGSFVEKDGFNDIDIGIYLAEEIFQSDDALFKYGLRLAAKVDLALKGYEVDAQILNFAPLSFRFRVINAGRLLFSMDERQRIQFETRTRDFYFDFLPHRRLLYRKIVGNVGILMD